MNEVKLLDRSEMQPDNTLAITLKYNGELYGVCVEFTNDNFEDDVSDALDGALYKLTELKG
jgi:hypothetical protein